MPISIYQSLLQINSVHPNGFPPDQLTLINVSFVRLEFSGNNDHSFHLQTNQDYFSEKGNRKFETSNNQINLLGKKQKFWNIKKC